jgi:hypothetical protein
VNYVVQQGHPLGELYVTGFKKDDKGRVIVNNNGVPLKTNGKSYNAGIAAADWNGTISSSFSIKNWTVSFEITHRQGGIVASQTRSELSTDGVLKKTLKGRNGGLIFGKNIFTNYTAVTKDGKPNNIKVNAEKLWHDLPGEAYILDATNTRLRELSIGYSLSTKMLRNSPISMVRISLTGRNLFYITRATPGLNSDMAVSTATGSLGFAYHLTPDERTFGINIKLNF